MFTTSRLESSIDTIYKLRLKIQGKLGIHPSQQPLVYTENISDLDLIAWNHDALFEAWNQGANGHFADRHWQELLVCASEQLLNGRLLSDYHIQDGSFTWTKSQTRQS